MYHDVALKVLFGLPFSYNLPRNALATKCTKNCQVLQPLIYELVAARVTEDINAQLMLQKESLIIFRLARMRILTSVIGNFFFLEAFSWQLRKLHI